jgi:hypothetical protein
MPDIQVKDLLPDSLIHRIGEQIRITDVHTHPRFGLECRARRGSQTTQLWYRASIVQKWLDDAVGVEIPWL